MIADFAIHDEGGRYPPRPYPAHHAGDGRKGQMAPQVPQGKQGIVADSHKVQAALFNSA